MLTEYVLEKIKGAALWVICCLVFAAVFALYELPLGAVGYAGAISGFVSFLFFLWDMSVYRKKAALLEKAAEEAEYGESPLTDAPGNEGRYIRIINKLCEKMHCRENEISAKISDMNDYYTLWVHQIKTPIAAMSLILQNSEDGGSAELRENLQRIEDYTEMVLVFLRLDSDYTDFVIKEYSLDGIVRQAVRKFSSQFIRKRLSLEITPSGRTVLTDEKWLLFVLEQVISNAVKYTRSGGAKIYLEAPLTLCIKDTGIGVSPEDLPRIFDKGYTGLNGRLDKKASGIGLYLCRRVCEKLRHNISAESSENGTVIRLDLSRQSVRME